MELNKQNVDFGAIMGIIVVVIVLIVGAFYFIGQRIEKQKEFQNAMNQNQIATTAVTTSDEVSDIEKDANSINLDNLGEGINNL